MAERGIMSTVIPIGTLAELRESTAATITMKTAAVVLGCDPRTVSAGIAEGSIPAVRLGRRVVIPRERFLALFDVNDD